VVRIFVAAWPPDGLRRDLEAWAQEQSSPGGVRWVGPDRLHLTLAFAGEVDGPEQVLAAVSEVVAGVAPVSAVVGVATVRLGGVLAVPVEGVDDLGRRLTAAVATAVGRDEPRGFRGHLTLARVGRRQRVPSALVGVDVLGGSHPAWPVDRLDVVRSHLGVDPRYETLDTIPLG